MKKLPAGKDFPSEAAANLRAVAANLTVEQAGKVKATEKVTNHDIKAVEYFIKEQFDKLGLEPFKEWVHFSLTSQDINNTSIPLLLKDSLEQWYIPSVKGLIKALQDRTSEWDVSMLARTHGQPASPTNVGKEFKVFIERVENQLLLLEQVPHSCKFGGAT